MSNTGKESENERNYYLEERQEKILELVNSKGSVQIDDLSERFNVSATTIRKDMRALEEEGKLRRTHGGAIKINPNETELHFKAAKATAQDEKVRIGQTAAKLVKNNDTLLIQSGTTCQAFVHALKDKMGLTIITSSLVIALDVEDLLPDANLILLGGKIRNGYHYTQGGETIMQLERCHAPVSFHSCNAFSFDNGFSAHTIEQASYAQALLESSNTHIMLADSSKFGVTAPYKMCNLSNIDCLITDNGLDYNMRDELHRAAPDLEIIYT